MTEAQAIIIGVVLASILSTVTGWALWQLQQRHEERVRLAARCEEVVELCQRIVLWNTALSGHVRDLTIDRVEQPPGLLRLFTIASAYLPVIYAPVTRLAEKSQALPVFLRDKVAPFYTTKDDLPDELRVSAKQAHADHAAVVFEVMQLAINELARIRGVKPVDVNATTRK